MDVFACNDINNLADALRCIRSARSDIALLKTVDYSADIFEDFERLEIKIHQIMKRVHLSVTE